jgi:predicted ferric reductase
MILIYFINLVVVSAAGTSSSVARSSPYQPSPAQIRGHQIDKSVGPIYLYSLLGVIALVFAYVTADKTHAHLRRLASMTDNKGALHYFSTTSPYLRWAKSNLLYAPLLNYRRAREIKFSKHIRLGTLPTRFQAVFLILIVATNIFTCTWNIPWSGPEKDTLAILRDRTGTLSVANMVPIMLLATAKNPLIWLLDISYDTFNLMHRWFGRLSAVQAILHALCWLVGKVQSQGWDGVRSSLQHPFIYNGLIAAVAMAILLLQSPKVFRSLAYEFFLHTHFVLVLLIVIFLWLHLDGHWQQHMLLTAICTWAFARGWRLVTLLWRSVGRGGSKAKIEPLDGGAVKISLKTARPWTYTPGQSLYLTIPSVGLWTAHPFSVAWSGVEHPLDRSASVRTEFSEKNPTNRNQEIEAEVPGDRTISLVVKSHSGLTRRLFDRAAKPDAILTVNAWVEGPYGTQRSLASYGTVMLFASGVGITHQIGYVKQLVEGYCQGTLAAKRVTLVWVVPTTDCIDWIRPWMHEILGMEGRRDVLRVLVYVTQAGLSQSITSPSETVRMSRGRPNVEDLMRTEALAKVGCMGVSVCAGGGLADEVRRVSRLMLDEGSNLDFMEEGFGW